MISINLLKILTNLTKMNNYEKRENYSKRIF